MKIVGNRTIITLAVVAVVAMLQSQGWIDETHGAQLKEVLLYLAGIFAASKVQAGVDAAGAISAHGVDPRR